MAFPLGGGDSLLLIDGTYDFRFVLYDADSGGSQVGSIVVKKDVNVSDGYFTVSSDLDILDGTALWLEVALRGWPGWVLELCPEIVNMV